MIIDYILSGFDNEISKIASSKSKCKKKPSKPSEKKRKKER